MKMAEEKRQTTGRKYSKLPGPFPFNVDMKELKAAAKKAQAAFDDEEKELKKALLNKWLDEQCKKIL